MAHHLEKVRFRCTDEKIEDWLARNAIDSGVVLNPSAGRHTLVLGRDQWMALVPGSHPLARRGAGQGVALSELATEPFILSTSSCAMNAQTLVERTGLELTDVRFTVRDSSTAHALIREGMGVALALASGLPDNMHELHALPLLPAIHREFGLVRSQAGQRSRAASALWGTIESATQSTHMH